MIVVEHKILLNHSNHETFSKKHKNITNYIAYVLAHHNTSAIDSKIINLYKKNIL
jgi:hypothetical protein